MNETVILGLDIGYERCGISVLKNGEIIYECLIQTSPKLEIASRLCELRKDLSQIKNDFNPDFVALEKLFFNRKNSTFEKICMAKGVALEVFHESQIHEIPPKSVKMAISGYGGSDKKTLNQYISKIIKKNVDHLYDDVVDAIALSLYLDQEIKMKKMYNVNE
jgi:crossover junction endodeoxyribonuclease RuvC